MKICKCESDVRRLPSAVTIGSGVAGAAVIAAHGVCVCVATLGEVIKVDFVQKTGWEFARGFSLLREEEDAEEERELCVVMLMLRRYVSSG
jgi:hypothetical protein